MNDDELDAQAWDDLRPEPPAGPDPDEARDEDCPPAEETPQAFIRRFRALTNQVFFGWAQHRHTLDGRGLLQLEGVCDDMIGVCLEVAREAREQRKDMTAPVPRLFDAGMPRVGSPVEGSSLDQLSRMGMGE